MLQALLHNKLPKPAEAGSPIPLAKDTLTASVFGRLRYAPAHCLTRIFQEIAARHACTLTDETLGSLQRVHFWPRYVLDGRAYVESDIVVEFDRAVILVQAALGDAGADPTPAQWQQELHSLRLAVAYEKKMGKLVMLGGGTRCPKSEDVWPISWRNFFHIAQAVLPQTQEHERLLLADMRNALELHGVTTRTPAYLTNFAEHCPRVQPVLPKEYLQGAPE